MKSTKGEIRRRVEQVMKIILFGGEFHDIREYAEQTDEATGRPWGVKKTALWVYQQRAYDLIEKQMEPRREKVFARHIQQRRQMFALAMEAGDLSTALQIAKDEADLHGLYPAAAKPGGEGNTNVNVYVDARGTRITVEEFERLPLEDRIRILRDPVSASPENRNGKLDAIRADPMP